MGGLRVIFIELGTFLPEPFYTLAMGVFLLALLIEIDFLGLAYELRRIGVLVGRWKCCRGFLN